MLAHAADSGGGDDMVKHTHGACVALAIALFTLTALGCAGTAAKPVAVKDLSPLAGKWNGWVRQTTGGAVPATFELAPSGQYVTRAGAFSSQGTAQVKDGSIVLMSTGGSGRLGITERTSTASLAERPDGILVLKGAGRDEIGPFDFEFTRQK
jgi:hypothetical protein